jgi:hypothetical protein
MELCRIVWVPCGNPALVFVSHCNKFLVYLPPTRIPFSADSRSGCDSDILLSWATVFVTDDIGLVNEFVANEAVISVLWQLASRISISC